MCEGVCKGSTSTKPTPPLNPYVQGCLLLVLTMVQVFGG